MMHFRQNIIDRTVLPSMKSIGGIAPGAAKRASGQPYKHAGLSSVARLALNAMEDFSDTHTNAQVKKS
jgi:hypothetical protein